MIDNKNIDPTATMLRIPVVLAKDAVAASQSDIEQAAFRAPFAGTILSVHFHTVALTDADDSVRLDIKKGSTSVLSATVDPVSAGTVAAGTLKTDGTEDFVAGDKLALFATTGSGDAITSLSATLVIRPQAGSEAPRPTV